MTKKKMLIIAICAVLVLAAGYGGYRIWCHNIYDSALFDQSYGISLNLYGNLYANNIGNTPEYALSFEGALYTLDYSGAKLGDKKLTGPMKQTELTEDNFDTLFDDGAVLAYGAEPASIREHNVEAWNYHCLDGRMYYILRQENGDVLLALGKDGKLGGMYLLKSVGDADVFYDYIKEERRK